MHHDDAVLINDAVTAKTITGITPPKPLHRNPAKPAGALVALLLGTLLTLIGRSSNGCFVTPERRT
jgi:hypothetical protein